VKIQLACLALALSSLAAGCGASPTAAARTESTTETSASTAVAMSGPPAALEVTQPMTEILGFDGVNVAIRSRMLIRNPNPYPVTLHLLDGVLYLDGAQAATARIEGTDVLDGRTDRVFQLDANVPAQLLRSVRTGTYVTSGTITASAPDGTSFVSPFSFEGPVPGF
jgi:hypothetical protein